MKYFSDWFNVTNPEHMLAFIHLQDFGVWPEGFVPKDMVVDAGWYLKTVYNMADEWVKKWRKLYE